MVHSIDRLSSGAAKRAIAFKRTFRKRGLDAFRDPLLLGFCAVRARQLSAAAPEADEMGLGWEWYWVCKEGSHQALQHAAAPLERKTTGERERAVWSVGSRWSHLPTAALPRPRPAGAPARRARAVVL